MHHQFNIDRFYVLPHTVVFLCFVWISEQTVIITVYGINWLLLRGKVFTAWYGLNLSLYCRLIFSLNPQKPNDHYSGRTALLIFKRCILYIYSTNIGTEYFKHGIYSLFFPLQNAVCFIILMYLVPVLFTFYIQGVIKLKKKILAPKG